MSASIANDLRPSAGSPSPTSRAQTKPSTQEPTESVTYATSFGRFSHLANRVNALDTLDQSDRASLAGHVLKSVQDELQRLASENTPHAPGRTSDLNIEQLRAFGSAFSEMLTARIEGRSLDGAIFMRLDPNDARLLGRISDAMQLAELKNHCACVLHGIHNDRSAIAYFRQRYHEMLSGLTVDESTVHIERPRPGLIRYFVSDEILRALDLSQVGAAAMASSTRDSGNVSFTIYRSCKSDDSRYLNENRPHETMHTFFNDAVAKVLGIKSEEDIIRDQDFAGIAFVTYIDEGIAQAAGGKTHSFSALLHHSSGVGFRNAFAERDRGAYDCAMGAVRELHNLFHESNLKDRMRQAELSPTALIPLFVSSSSLEELRDRLVAFHKQLPDVQHSPGPGGGWGALIEG